MLLYQLLEVNPEKRIGSNEAYDHPYISEKLDDILEQMQTIENPNIEDKISKIKDNFQSKKLREKHLEQKRSQEIFEDVKNFQTKLTRAFFNKINQT